MKFIYVLPGWEGSAADSRVLRDALNRPSCLEVPSSRFNILRVFIFYFLILLFSIFNTLL
jgi:hypothetical protein